MYPTVRNKVKSMGGAVKVARPPACWQASRKIIAPCGGGSYFG
jgi:hypothetical protein